MLNMQIEVRVGLIFSLLVRVWVRLWFKVLRGGAGAGAGGIIL